MTAVTQYFGIGGDVPFVDVDIHADTRLFLDPHRIRLDKGDSPYKWDAIACLDSFFELMSRLVMGSLRADAIRGISLLSQFHEPAETHLGMAGYGFHGHGGAGGLGHGLWDVLAHDLNALFAVGILRHLEDLPLFIRGVDRDITSDITTRICYSALAAFTLEMMRKYPQLTSGGTSVQVMEKPVWDPKAGVWARVQIELPSVEGSALLLVPKAWVGKSLLMSARRFYGVSVLGHIQDLRVLPGPDGASGKPTKKALMKEWGLRDVVRTNYTAVNEARAVDVDLLEAFRRYVSSRQDVRPIA